MDRLKRWELVDDNIPYSYGQDWVELGPVEYDYPNAEIDHEVDAYCEAPEVRKLEDRAAKMEEALGKLRNAMLLDSAFHSASGIALIDAALETKED